MLQEIRSYPLFFDSALELIDGTDSGVKVRFSTECHCGRLVAGVPISILVVFTFTLNSYVFV